MLILLQTVITYSLLVLCLQVRWENGTKSRHKYGADGVFDLQIQYVFM